MATKNPKRGGRFSKPAYKHRHTKVYGRIDARQEKILRAIIDESGFADQVDVVSAALDFLFMTREKYPLGHDLQPQVPWKDLAS